VLVLVLHLSYSTSRMIVSSRVTYTPLST
jgi:hypothetical protein